MTLRTADFYACRAARGCRSRAIALRDAALGLARTDAPDIAVAYVRGHMRIAARAAVQEARHMRALHDRPDSEIGEVCPA
jgi:hypothetical protein